MLVLKRTFFGLACVLAISLLFTPRAYAAGTDNAARAAIVVHPETGAVLYEKNADERLGIASTTKIMTALVVLEHCALDEPVEILRTLHSFDPCLACSTHVMSPDGDVLTTVKVR